MCGGWSLSAKPSPFTVTALLVCAHPNAQHKQAPYSSTEQPHGHHGVMTSTSFQLASGVVTSSHVAPIVSNSAALAVLSRTACLANADAAYLERGERGAEGGRGAGRQWHAAQGAGAEDGGVGVEGWQSHPLSVCFG